MNIDRIALVRRFALAALAGLLLGLAGCNTVHGFGEDLQHLGGAISEKAK
ncbi:entericidin A/B family lipoprotein [Paraburkholderia sp. LEh10]|nr:entericidin A/B family lipoprotein [Paraburkholderia sp. LEh10]MBP0592073.1 entericidin A/B family lipoprotein [Paraburkholderia sp. LEh10]